MTNPFEDPDGRYLVLANDENQHSLWPTFIDVPAGWTVVLDDSDRENALRYVDEHWVDMRPRSLVERMDADSPGPLSD